MAKAAMPLDELDQWLRGRADRQPAATNLSMLDGYVTAIVAGPVSFDPREWICPLLAIDADAFNHGGTPEFAAISAVAVRHNDISNILSTAPDRFEPIYRRKPNRDIDARPWCRGFYAAMQLQMSAWAPLLNTDDINYGLLLPICAHCVDEQGHPLLGPTRKPEGKALLRKGVHGHPCRRPRPCASTGCRPVIDRTRDYARRGTSYRLQTIDMPSASQRSL
jgi:uncharacterized protein